MGCKRAERLGHRHNRADISPSNERDRISLHVTGAPASPRATLWGRCHMVAIDFDLNIGFRRALSTHRPTEPCVGAQLEGFVSPQFHARV